jgi:hypothetical protein
MLPQVLSPGSRDRDQRGGARLVVTLDEAQVGGVFTEN